VNKQERYFYFASVLALIFLPLFSYPFGIHTSLGFLAGAATGILIVSYFHLLVNTLLEEKKKRYLLISFIPRLVLLFALALFLSIYQEEVSPLTFALGVVIIIFVMLFSYLAEE